MLDTIQSAQLQRLARILKLCQTFGSLTQITQSQSGLRLCCSYATKSGFLAARPIWKPNKNSSSRNFPVTLHSYIAFLCGHGPNQATPFDDALFA